MTETHFLSWKNPTLPSIPIYHHLQYLHLQKTNPQQHVTKKRFIFSTVSCCSPPFFQSFSTKSFPRQGTKGFHRTWGHPNTTLCMGAFDTQLGIKTSVLPKGSGWKFSKSWRNQHLGIEHDEQDKIRLMDGWFVVHSFMIINDFVQKHDTNIAGIRSFRGEERELDTDSKLSWRYLTRACPFCIFLSGDFFFGECWWVSKLIGIQLFWCFCLKFPTELTSTQKYSMNISSPRVDSKFEILKKQPSNRSRPRRKNCPHKKLPKAEETMLRNGLQPWNHWGHIWRKGWFFFGKNRIGYQ